MLKRLMPAALTFALLSLPLPTAAQDFTDIWFRASEGGYGFNLIQAEDVIFITFFIYGTGNQPTWYVATMQRDVNGNFSGNLYSTVGSYFGAPWNPAAYNPTLVGSVSFFPSGPYTGTLTYVVSGTTVTKVIQRQTLKTIILGGNYTGGQSGAYSGSGCSLGAYKDNFDVTVTQTSAGAVSFAFTFKSGLSCAISGTLIQQGQLYAIRNATYVCSDGTNTTANLDEIKATTQGIEGILSARSVAGVCNENASFSAVLL